MNHQENAARAFIRAIDAELARRGRGAISDMESALGLVRGSGWWHRRRKVGDLSVGHLMAILDHLGLDTVRFVRKAIRGEDRLELDRPIGEAPDLVCRAWDRFHDDGDFSGTLGEDMLKTLDRMRFEDPQAVIQQVAGLIPFCPHALLPRLLGVTGSAWRLMVHLNKAEHAVCAAIEMATLLTQREILPEMLQRLAYVHAEGGDFASALTVAEKATHLYFRLENSTGAAKTLVDQGIWLRLLGRNQEAIAVQRVALDGLPPAEAHNRFAALQNIGLNYRELGQVQEALRYSFKAEAAAVGLPRVEKDRGKWLRASLLTDLGKFDEAADLLSQVVEGLARIQLGDMALAACDLAQVELLRDQPLAAVEAVSALLPLLEPLRDNQIISAAIRELLWSGEAGITLALLEKTRSQIEGELRHPTFWRRLWVRAS